MILPLWGSVGDSFFRLPTNLSDVQQHWLITVIVGVMILLFNKEVVPILCGSTVL